ncbi:hypothetical protein JXA63_01725 [Candidatus Woesebacteria bacterium]|nr:hypothetical protein [Candidatus Woesebacteria bacterium]
MEKYFDNALRKIVAAATLILIIAVLIMPEPKYYKYKTCTDSISTDSPDTTNQKCGPNVIEWGPSIAQRLRDEYMRRKEGSQISIILPSPPSVIKNWDTYSSENHNFQFKYPEFLDIINEGKDQFSYILSLTLADKTEGIDTYDVNVVIDSTKDTEENLNFCIENAGEARQTATYSYEGKKLQITNQILKIGNYNACMQKMNMGNQLIYNVLIKKDDNFLTIQFLTEGDPDSVEELTNQILSTITYAEE